MKIPVIVLSVCVLALVNGCSEPNELPNASGEEDTGISLDLNSDEKVNGDEPDRITVEHVLIGFKGTLPDNSATRSQAEAQKLAQQVLEKAKSGSDFAQLIKEYSDDSGGGRYMMDNFGLPGFESPNPATKIFKRENMVAAFGDVGFKLKVGEIGLAEFNKSTSPFGYHIIRRAE